MSGIVERADMLGGEKTAGSCESIGVRPLSDALIAERDRIISARRSCLRLGLHREALLCEQDLAPIESQLLALNQPPLDAFYVESSIPAGVQLADYRNRGAA